MQKKEPKKPVVFNLKQLPEFIQIGVAEMWEKAGVDPKGTIDPVFTYFEGIYTARPMPTDLFVHESVHYIRQGAGEDQNLAKEWWLRYLSDPGFRYSEEVMAYREQYRFIKGKTNKPQAFEHAKRLANDLSGPLYGNICSFHQALHAIIS